METGTVIEFIDRQKVVCAVVQEVGNQRLRLLTENNREVSLAESRLLHSNARRLDSGLGRQQLVAQLQQIAAQRKELAAAVNIEELWEVLHSEQEWIDLPTMTEFCFSRACTSDHEAAVFRAFFANRLYFKFDHDRFFPLLPQQVEQALARARAAARQAAMIERGGLWLRRAFDSGQAERPQALLQDFPEFLDILKSYYIFDTDSPHAPLGRMLLAKAGIDRIGRLFRMLVQLGIFTEHENTDIVRLNIPVAFSSDLERASMHLQTAATATVDQQARRDLTGLHLITIDGQYTLDFDDALSLEVQGNNYRVGIHVADVGACIRPNDLLDQEAQGRGSSIYLPDQKIPMLPPSLAEGLCSLKAGTARPAISILITLSADAEVVDHEIVASHVRVADQLSYYDANVLLGEGNRRLAQLCDLAVRFRRQRLEKGAIQISLPEINLWLSDDGSINLGRVSRESPGRMLVAEMMILANWVMARFLTTHQLPAVFRCQAPPRERLYQGINGGTLFQHWMQRKQLSRFMLRSTAEPHAGLGLEAYVTATSPIRKYYDLVTQRQIRAALGFEAPLNQQEIDDIILKTQQPMAHVSKIQYLRQRYWLLKYLESHIGAREEALVLSRRREGYLVLLTEYMLECSISLPPNVVLKPEDLIQVTIQHVNARKDMLVLFLS